MAGTMSPAPLAVTMAMVASLAMALPISTPPNAIAYGRGGLSVRDMAVPGAIIGVAGTVLVVLIAPWLLRLVGVAN
jgi:sodium-dependent dicarboxylate transporter 2/3/5